MAESYPNENWRAVVGYEGWYAVSDYGRVMRVKKGPSTKPGHVFTPILDRRGYPRVCLRYRKDDQPRQYPAKVHRLVMAAFIGPCPAGLQVNHKNGIKTDNRVGNLEYVTAKENTHHAWTVLGHDGRGENQGQAKLTEQAVRDMRRRYRPGIVTYGQLASEYGVTITTVKSAIDRKNWAHVV
jgi:hypothetical protein